MIDAENDFVGNICHIEAASEGGERFNPNQTDEERWSYGNLILLCYEHHIKTNNVTKYTVEVLRKMKSDHEALAEHFDIPDITLNHIFNEGLEKITLLLHAQGISLSEHRREFKEQSAKNDETLAILLEEVRNLREPKSPQAGQLLSLKSFEISEKNRNKIRL